jgi:hypothetical protein
MYLDIDSHLGRGSLRNLYVTHSNLLCYFYSKNVIVRQWNSVGRASRSIALPSAGAPGSRVEEL